ncbi:hypothetical protein Ancab_001534 [Ancistrocladus abbreviatus]
MMKKSPFPSSNTLPHFNANDNPITDSTRKDSISDKQCSMITNRGLVLPPFFLWSLGITSLFALFILFSSKSNPPVKLPSKHTLSFPPLHHHHRPHASSSIKPHSDGVDGCDLFKGQWVPDNRRPIYTNYSCQTIPDSKNCFRHGREDKEFLHWRWKPNGCQLPRFDPSKFLQIVHGKKLAFVGDSVARNHFESLLCLLSQAETPIDAYKDSEDHFRTWFFPSSNFTLMIFWSKFLMKHEERVINGSNSGIFNLHLDQVDNEWASRLPGIDYTIISSAHWFFRRNYLYDRGNLVGCVYCNDANVTDLGLNYSLRMAFRVALRYINECKECKGMVTLLRTFSPAHFEGGTWDTGGSCNRTRPYTEEEANNLKSYDWELRNLQVEELDRVRKEGERDGKKFRSLDVMRLMLMRPDGHPGSHWNNKWMKGYNDCVHWCMPGPIDVWNDFLMAALKT